MRKASQLYPLIFGYFMMIPSQAIPSAPHAPEQPTVQPPASTAVVEEKISPSGATLQTARTIYVEPMLQDLHLYLIAELNKQKGLYQVSLDKREADLWMTGSANLVKEGKWSEVLQDAAQVLGQSAPRVRMTASVFIVPRGGKEILWAGETSDRSGWVSSTRGRESHIAKELVKKLRNTVKKERSAVASKTK